MSARVLRGDCVEQMKKLPESSIDAIVTDPPYGLEFMGKEWDKLDQQGAGVVEITDEKANGIFHSKGFSHGIRYGKAPGAGQQAWHEAWAREAYRVLKPGGHLLAFGGSRTYHRLASAVEDAGFEIRDQMMWLYGSGFPKSLDVSKALDKKAGAEREVVRVLPSSRKASGPSGFQMTEKLETAPATDAAKTWQGWGTALKPAHEPIVVARKPLIGTVAQNVLEHGTGALNIDGCRVETDEKWESGDRPNSKPLAGLAGGDGLNAQASGSHPQGRWPANVILDEEAGALLDAQSGTSKSAKGKQSYKRAETTAWKERGGSFTPGREWQAEGYGDQGGASRFFYCPKANKKERDAGLEGEEQLFIQWQTGNGASGKPNNMSKDRNTRRKNTHPTVKPIELMRYLCRLVTPPGGTVLDPFLGSGTTGCAAVLEGFDFIGIEREAEYVKIARARISHWAPAA